MRNIILLPLVICLFLHGEIPQLTIKRNIGINYQECNINTDPLYVRRQVLDTFAHKLNYVASYYKIQHPRGYSVTEENFYNFFVQDLTDTTNTSESKTQCIQFKDGHVYHFSSLNRLYLYSNICILQKGKMYFFLGINCKSYINSIEEVIIFLNSHLKDNDERSKVLYRVKHYKKYGYSYQVDSMSTPICEQ